MSKKDLKSHVQTKKEKKRGIYKGAKTHKVTKQQYDQMTPAEQRMYNKSDLSFEGSQYEAGRKEKVKNLIKLDNGDVRNQHGVEFTQADKRRLESLVNSANAKRKRQLKQEGAIVRKNPSAPEGDTNASVQRMGVESDFIITRKTKSLQRFKSREQFEQYIEHLQDVNSKDYMDRKIDMYRENHITALEYALDHEGEDIINHIKNMSRADYKKLIQERMDEFDISFTYGPDQRETKLNHYRAILGLPLKEDYIEDI